MGYWYDHTAVGLFEVYRAAALDLPSGGRRVVPVPLLNLLIFHATQGTFPLYPTIRSPIGIDQVGLHYKHFREW